MKHQFDRPLSLATKLREFAGKKWVGYDWAISTRCNCGLFAAYLLGKKEAELLINGQVGSWSLSANGTDRIHPAGFCKLTGMPILQIFKKLYEKGLEKEDFTALENCGTKEKKAASSASSGPNRLRRIERSMTRQFYFPVMETSPPLEGCLQPATMKSQAGTIL